VGLLVAPPHDGKAEVNGVIYHYLLAKVHGDPVVLLHGWGSTSYMWRFVMPQLAARGYTVDHVDLELFGALLDLCPGIRGEFLWARL
jgi:pimeloyl-ACP methyl ester carboxylesterase